MAMDRAKTVIEVKGFDGPGARMVGKGVFEDYGPAKAMSDSFVEAGYEVSVIGKGLDVRIEVVSRTTTKWSDSLKADMQAAVEPYLLALCLRTGRTLDVNWSFANVVGADGKEEAFGWEGFRVTKPRDPIQPLGAFAGDAKLISAHGELRAAIEQIAGSMDLAVDRPGASMALAYLAVEGLVTVMLQSTTGSLTSAPHWSKAAPLLATNPDLMLHLLWSTQLGRHVDPVRAKQELTKRGWQPLAATECCEIALDIVGNYAGTL